MFAFSDMQYFWQTKMIADNICINIQVHGIGWPVHVQISDDQSIVYEIIKSCAV